MTRLSRCRAWNRSQVTFPVMFPITGNIQIFLCNVQSFRILRALLSTIVAQKRRHCPEWTLPAAIFRSDPRHCGSFGDPSSSWIPVPQTRKTGRKEKQCINLRQHFLQTNWLIWDEALKKLDHALMNWGFREATNSTTAIKKNNYVGAGLQTPRCHSRGSVWLLPLELYNPDVLCD